MSGDVQPRKRKDKKRKKDDGTEQVPSHTHHSQTPSSSTQNEDLNIHVHKEDGTGGGICAKIVFFVLFSALAVLIGLIITEHRGLTDLDVAEQESRFSYLFEGWIDTSTGHDDHDDHLVSSLEDDHDEHDEHEDESLEETQDHEEEEEEEQDEADENEESEEIEEEDEDDEAEAQTEEEEDDEEDEPNVSQDDDDVSELKDTDEEEEEVSEENPEEDEEQEEDKSGDDDEVDNDVTDDDDDDEDTEDASVEEDLPEKSQEQQSEEVAEDETLPSKENEEDATGNEVEVEENPEGDGQEENEDQNNSKNINADKEDSDKESDAETYEFENITNKDDEKIKEKIDEAHKKIQNNTAVAIKIFDALLQKYPFSPRSLYGKAQALDVLAERKRSNVILEKAIATYLQVLDLKDVPDALFEAVAERCINRMRFIGKYNRAIDIHFKLIQRFPEEPKHRNQLVVSYLTINRVNKARVILQETLSKYPNDGFALVHYGFILKTVDNNLLQAIHYLKKGIATKAPGVIDGRFYFHLGDALARTGKTEEAMKVYEEGVEQKLFLSKYQRSLYNVRHLKGQPWWNKQETPYSNFFLLLENNWKTIRDEGMSVLNKNGLFQSESENLKDTGDWKQFELFARGQKNMNNCQKCPVTCKIIESMPDAKGCKRGQTKFSVMHPGTHVWPHCGPTNCRLRVHLGLNVPDNTYIRVADEIRSWKNGEVLIFDDSFEHEVWHNGTSVRLVLIVDVWHPELSSVEKTSLSPI